MGVTKSFPRVTGSWNFGLGTRDPPRFRESHEFRNEKPRENDVSERTPILSSNHLMKRKKMLDGKFSMTGPFVFHSILDAQKVRTLGG